MGPLGGLGVIALLVQEHHGVQGGDGSLFTDGVDLFRSRFYSLFSCFVVGYSLLGAWVLNPVITFKPPPATATSPPDPPALDTARAPSSGLGSETRMGARYMHYSLADDRQS